MSPHRRIWWTGGLLALVAGLVISSTVVLPRSASIPSAQTAPPAVKVAVAVAQRGPLPVDLPGIGTLEAVRQVTVPAEVDGRVTRILFDAGTYARAGQLLVQLNDAPDRGDAARLAAQATNARALLDRTRRLLPRQAATEEQLDQAQAAHDQTAGDLQRVQALIAQKQITAPFDGALGIRQVHLGQFVRAGDPIVSLTDSRTLFANFTLPEQVLSSLKRGQRVALTVDAYPTRTFTATITTIEPQVSPTARTLRVQATLRNPDGLLAPGMFVNARVALPPRPDVITVPETAIISSAYGDSVYIVHDASAPPPASRATSSASPASSASSAGSQDAPAPAAATPHAAGSLIASQAYVKTGQRIDQRVVIEEGLAAGARVVTSGQLRLHNGAAVSIVDRDTLALQTASPALGSGSGSGSRKVSGSTTSGGGQR